MNRSYIEPAILFVFLTFLQVTFLRNLVLFEYASSFIYILPLLILPIETSLITLMLIGFALGIVVDSFYDTQGIHAAACVLMMYLRPVVIRLLTPGGGYDASTKLSPDELGWGWILLYLTPLVLIHHLTLFFIEAGNLNMFWLSLGKGFFSSFFTLILILLALYIRMPQKSSRL